MNNTIKAMLEICNVSAEAIEWLTQKSIIEFNPHRDELVIHVGTGKDLLYSPYLNDEFRKLPFRVVAVRFKERRFGFSTAKICSDWIEHNDYSRRTIDAIGW